MRWLQLLLLFVCTILCSGNNTTVADSKSCDPTQFSCKNGKCINIAWKCDGDDDCIDHSDELECPSTTCTEGFFRCDDGKCIPQRWTCDDSPDCRDDSDEKPELCANLRCDGYKCNASGLCISEEWKCDGYSDCPKGDDEADCKNVCDPHTEFMCSDDGKCISDRWRCDKHADCKDGSDEKNCSETSCDALGEKMCSDGQCINELWWCDGDADCNDKSDEINCTSTVSGQICGSNEFQCRLPATDVQCIHFAWKCDGDVDCSDGTDEIDCPQHTCRSDETKCGSLNSCVLTSYFCDGEEDCENGEDENNCNLTTVKEPSRCESGQFDCGNKCISNELICNGADDCGNGADESPDLHCPPGTNNSCTHNNGGCNHVCVPNTLEKFGHRCECRIGFDFADNSDTECEDIDECTITGTCSQVCTNTKGSYKCECFVGYTLTNHRYCKVSDGSHPELILADRHGIRRYHMETYHYSFLLQHKFDGAVAMDFDIRKQVVYWTDVQSEKIISANLVTNETKVITAENVSMSYGLAVDWIYGNLYISDTTLDKIEVVRLDGSHRKTLISDNLDEPRALVVDPSSGWMYWTDWGTRQPKIEKCGMNGQHRKEIVTQGIKWPNGLTIDYIQKRLYWVDAKLHSIGSTDLDGNNFKLILKNHRNLGHPFAITVFEDYLFWTDWMSNAVHKVSKFGRGNVTTIALDLKTPMDIHVYHIARQPAYINECGENNGGCSHLCLPVPQMKTKSPIPKKAECACPDNMILDGKFNCIQSSVPMTKKPEQVTDVPSSNSLQTVAPTKMPEQVTDISSSPHALVPDVKTIIGTEIRSRVNKSEADSTVQSTPEKEQVTARLATHTNISGGEMESSEGAGYIAGIVILSVLLVGSAVCAVVYYLLKRHKTRNVKSMNFDNPVYRKTTTEDQLIMEKNGSRSNLPQSMQPLNQDPDIV